MKHLILCGGTPWKSGNDGKDWVDALLSQTKDEVRVAFCMFAQDEADWPQTLKINTALLQKHCGDRSVACQMLEKDTFAEVSNWASVIVIVGGDPVRLQETLRAYGDLMELWDGKTVAGSSAGADIMCRRYVYLQDKTLHEGFGWVSANLIPHWQAPNWRGWDAKDWQWAADELADQPGGTPLLCIREGDFIEVAVR